jgi:hypothetical protein
MKLKDSYPFGRSAAPSDEGGGVAGPLLLAGTNSIRDKEKKNWR